MLPPPHPPVKVENYHHLYGNNFFGCYLCGEGRICMVVVCAVLGNGKHAVPFELVVMSVQQKLQWENKENKIGIFVRWWDNEGVLAVILVGNMCFEYFTVQTNEL